VRIDLEKNGEFIKAMLAILATLVSVLLGLLVSSADDQYRSLEVSVNSEATCIGEIFRLARGLPPAAAHVLQDLCIDYCDKVVSDEWPAMKRGQMSDSVNQVFENISDAIVQFHPVSVEQESLQSTLLSASSAIGQNRALRIVASRSSWTRRLFPLILTCAVVVLVSSYLYVGRGSWLLHSVLVALVAITLGTNIGVISLMTRPFSSEWTIQPEGFILRSEAMRRNRAGQPPVRSSAKSKSQQ
jgi:hypothetical protein